MPKERRQKTLCAVVSLAASGTTALVIAWAKSNKKSKARNDYLNKKAAARIAAENAARIAAENAAHVAAENASAAAAEKKAAHVAAEKEATVAAAKKASAAAAAEKKASATAAAKNEAAVDAAKKASATAAAKKAADASANAELCKKRRYRANECLDNAAAKVAAKVAATDDAKAVLVDFNNLCVDQEAYKTQKALVSAVKFASDAYAAAGAHSSALAYFDSSKVWLSI